MLFLFFLLNITNSVLNDISFSYLVSLLLVCYAMQETQVLSLVGKMPWRRKWQPTPVFLPGEFHGQRSLVGYIQSMGSQRMGQDLVSNTFTFTLVICIHLNSLWGFYHNLIYLAKENIYILPLPQFSKVLYTLRETGILLLHLGI